MKEEETLCVMLKGLSKKDRKKVIKLCKDNGFKWYDHLRFKDSPNLDWLIIDLYSEEIMYHEGELDDEDIKIELPKDFDKLKSYFEEEPKFEKGQWYESNFSHSKHVALYSGFGGCNVGFCGEKWIDSIAILHPENWQPADMTKVKELLIKEAERRGFKEGVCVNGSSVKNRQIDSEEYSIEEVGFYMDDFLILPFETGKWAEIIKPSHEDLEKENKELKDKIKYSDQSYVITKQKAQIQDLENKLITNNAIAKCCTLELLELLDNGIVTHHQTIDKINEVFANLNTLNK